MRCRSDRRSAIRSRPSKSASRSGKNSASQRKTEMADGAGCRAENRIPFSRDTFGRRQRALADAIYRISASRGSPGLGKSRIACGACNARYKDHKRVRLAVSGVEAGDDDEAFDVLVLVRLKEVIVVLERDAAVGIAVRSKHVGMCK